MSEHIAEVRVRVRPDMTLFQQEVLEGLRETQGMVNDFATVTITTEEATAATEAVRWQGVLAVEGRVTDDNTEFPRIILPGVLAWRDLPLTLMAQLETAEGHDGARVAGQIQEIWRDGEFILGKGIFETNEDGVEVARLVGNKTLRGVSVDLVGTTWSLVDAETLELIDAESLSMEELLTGNFLLGLTEGAIGAATIAPLQALADATIALVASSMVESRFDSTIGLILEEEPEEITAAAPRLAPRAWFETPEAEEITPLTITSEGHVFGHAFLWDSCHTGYIDRCVQPTPSASNYRSFHLGTIDTADGDEIAVGQITLDTGHAPMRRSADAVRAHYDNTGTCVADVRVTDGVFGGWVAGALRNVPESKARELKAAKLSGDWRQVNGVRDLVGLLAVNVPGFPVPQPEARLVASAAGEVEICALVAAGIVPDAVELEIEALAEEIIDGNELQLLAAAIAE